MRDAIIAVVVAFITSGGLVLGQRVSNKGERSTAMTPSYEALDARNTNLERRLDEQDKKIADLKAKDEAKDERIDDLEQKHVEKSRTVDDLTLLVRQLFAWIRDGAKPPPPTIPPHLRDQIGEDFEVARVTERSLTTTQTERTFYPTEEQP